MQAPPSKWWRAKVEAGVRVSGDRPVDEKESALGIKCQS